MFSATTYQNRRKILVSDLNNSGLVLLVGNNELPVNYKGNVYRFRQDSNFLYFIGIDLPGLAATIDTSNGETILYGDDVSVEDSVWTGDVPSLMLWAEKSGFSKVKPFNSLFADIKKSKEVHYLPPYPADRKIFLSQLLGKPVESINNGFSKKFICAVVSQRSIKSDEEVAQIESTMNQVTGKYHVEAMKMALPGEYEYRIAGQIESTMLKHNCFPAFNIICSVRGEILHNVNYAGKLDKNNLLLVDSGAENEMHYATDITRTTPVGGKFNQQQKEIYSLVLAASEKSISEIVPGKTYKGVHLNAAKIMTRGLIELGLMKGNAEEIVEAGAHAMFFPHGLGHMMGLDVHDMEDLGEDYVGYDDSIKRSEQFGTAYLRLARKLQPGFVLTVEPGLYFIPRLIEQWQAEKLFTEFINYSSVQKYVGLGGVRIEDNILVTENSCRVIGNPIPKSINEVVGLFP